MVSRRRARGVLPLVLCVLLGIVLRPQPSYGRPGPSAAVAVAAVRGGVQLSWAASSGASALPAWPTAEVAGFAVPAQLVALAAPGAGPVTPRIRQLREHPWRGAPPTAVDSALLAAGGSGPNAPVAVLREGRYRGARIVVVAVAALYQRDGAWYALDGLDATLDGLRQADLAALARSTTAYAPALPTPNPLAASASLKVTVGHAGVQQLTGAELAAAGLDLAGLDPARLQLRRAGVEVPLELRGADDGRLDLADTLRFFAPAPGDRWNAADTYWLGAAATPGARMAARSVTPGSAPLRASAVEQGAWVANALYDSTLAGADGDHWFAADLRAAPGRASNPLDVPLASALQPVGGSVQLVVTGSAYTSGAHTLAVTVGGAIATTAWSGRGDWSRSLSVPADGASARLVLQAGSAADGVEVDHVRWQRTASLVFGGSGAAFSGVDGAARYQLTDLPPGATLYDVSAPLQPTVLATASGSSLVFEDGPTARAYVVAGPGTLWTPAVAPHTPADVLRPLDADLVYIAPAQFHAALAPLVAHRAAQGHAVAVVDIQALYDTWSYGQVAPAAIREFLRYAVATWHTPPTAVTLVGDGTSDPLNYTGRNNTTFIPPYLAPVDPWLGETACETCYGQLDGASPLDDPLPDLQIGRLPVKSAAELQTVAAKLIAYETAPVDITWQARSVFIADNADGAGDFAAYADAAAALQPRGVAVDRLYYDPMASGVAWREPDAVAAHQRTMATLSAGAAFVNYVGHSNHWQWAVTDPTTTPGSLLGLYDVDVLGNAGRLPVVLEMTCYTSAFQQPAYSGTTIDERFLLAPNGGAVAVWGPTGLGVAHGHDALLRGFYGRLWSGAGAGAALGALVDAGYLELFSAAGCCQDTLRTFALLGDPATRLRALAAHQVLLPAVQR